MIGFIPPTIDSVRDSHGTHKARPLVLIFAEKNCPCVGLAHKDLNQLASDLEPFVDVQLVVNIQPQSTSWYAKHEGISFKVCPDASLRLARDYGAEFSLDMVLLDSKKRLLMSWSGCGRDALQSLNEALTRMLASPARLKLNVYSDAVTHGCSLSSKW